MQNTHTETPSAIELLESSPELRALVLAGLPGDEIARSICLPINAREAAQAVLLDLGRAGVQP